MNNKFRILWFEDNAVWYKTQKRFIDDLLNQYCLVSDIDCRRGDFFDVSSLQGNEYDLILMDYMLASEGTTGEKIIAKIRANSILTDILFYSSDTKSLIRVIKQADPPVDGVYYTARDVEYFHSKVMGLINKIIKRSEDLINLRGFVLDNSCDFEIRVKEILNICWQKFDSNQKDILEEAVQKTICLNQRQQEKNLERVTSKEPFFPVVNNDEHFLCHSDRLYLLTKVISIMQHCYGFSKKEEFGNFKVNYETKISHYRNALGHRTAEEKTIEVIKGTLIPIDEDLHRLLRSNINTFESLISEIELFVTQNI